MAYGILKCDTVTFTDAGVDKSVTLSGLVQNPTFSGNVTVTGTLSGVTVTGTTANFTSGNFTNISGGTHTITSGVFAAGSAASPSITFTGDLNTGIYSPGADQVAISTGGSGRLFVDASGNVGVGASPTSLFSVRGNTPAINIDDELNTSSKIVFRPAVLSYAERGGFSINYSTGEFRQFCGASGQGYFQTFYVDGSERLRITSAGLVGVGTSSPNCLLEVKGGSAITTLANSYTNCGVLHQYSSTSLLAIGNDSTSPILQGVNATNNTARNLLLNPLGGSVGIGTSSPATNLEVYGAQGTILEALRLRNQNAGVAGVRQTFWQDYLVAAFTASRNGLDGRLALQTTDTSGNLQDRLFIDGSGRVGIGTNATAPDTTLYVRNTAAFDAQIKAVQTDSTGGVCVIKAESNSAQIDLMAGGSNYAANYMGADEAGLITQVAGDSMRFNIGGSYCRWTFGASEAARIDSSGRVGIGTSSVSALFHVAGDSSDGTQARITGATNQNYQLRWGFDTTNLAGRIQSIHVGTAYRPLLLNPDGGAVGIGTTVANSKLSLGNGVSTNDGLAIQFTGDNSTIARFYADTTTGQVSIGGIAASYYPVFYAAGSEKARIDTSGRLLVGTSSTSSNTTLLLQGYSGTTGPGVLRLCTTTSPPTSTEDLGYVMFGDATHVAAAWIQAQRDGGTWTAGSSHPGRLVFSTTADGASSPTERMRINSSGYLKYSNSGSYAVTNIAAGTEAYHQVVNTGSGFGVLISARDSAGTAVAASVTSTAASGDLFRGYVEASGGIVYRVFSNGNVENTNNSYGALSDIKLKENIVDANSQWDDIKALQVRNYNLKEGQTHTQIGLVAQEVELVSPGLVSESPDRDAEGNDLGTVTKSVNYSVLYMKAVKALQEAMERIELLEARLDAANL